ncbi:MAG: PLP-dependent aminotransferase family protein [Xenococcaceae cyanobacterium MO_188.B29]|nr:PLP-dependent aminotransferase family protein [Xenococcaceae cyanobacterium MO_188.B29]
MDLTIALDNNSAIPLYQQIYTELRQAILTGRLQPNQQIPSTRWLAKSLGISRSTVSQSYEQLFSEGYLQTKTGSGTFVSEKLPDDLLITQPIKSKYQSTSPQVELSTYGNNVKSANLSITYSDLPISFNYGRPALDRFPLKLWRKLLSRHCESNLDLLDYSLEPRGHQPLREAIASYLSCSRAVQCSPEQVIITSGSQQAINLVTRLFINPGDTIALEEPCYQGARNIFQAQGAKLIPVEVDTSGLIVEQLANISPVKLIYVTPSHQFPTGAVLSLPRRLELLRWAKETGAIIIEDDYDSEYRYSSRPIPALQGLDHHHSVIYMGTFSKVLFPSLRIGYLVVPENLQSIFTRAKWLCDRQSPLIEQQVLTDFINEGHLARHIRKMRNLYNQRRQALVAALKQYLAEKVTILGENAGIHLTITLKTNFSDREAIDRAAQVGVGLTSLSKYYLQAKNQGEFLLGYSELDELQIKEGIRRLALIF